MAMPNAFSEDTSRIENIHYQYMRIILNNSLETHLDWRRYWFRARNVTDSFLATGALNAEFSACIVSVNELCPFRVRRRVAEALAKSSDGPR